MQGLPAVAKMEIDSGRHVAAFPPLRLIAVAQDLSIAIADVPVLNIIAPVVAVHAGGEQAEKRSEARGDHEFFRA